MLIVINKQMKAISELSKSNRIERTNFKQSTKPTKVEDSGLPVEFNSIQNVMNSSMPFITGLFSRSNITSYRANDDVRLKVKPRTEFIIDKLWIRTITINPIVNGHSIAIYTQKGLFIEGIVSKSKKL